MSGERLAEQIVLAGSGTQVFRGLRVLGPVDLSGKTLASAVRFQGCVFDAGIDVDEASVRSIHVVGGELPWFTAQGAEINGLLSFRGARVRTVTLCHGRIARDLVLGADDDGPVTVCDTIDATALRVGGTVHAARLECRRGLRLDRAQIVGNVELLGAQLGPDGDGRALRADDARFGELVARPDATGRPFTTEGEIRLLRTVIDGACALQGAQLDVDGDGGLALTGDGMRCDQLTCDGVPGPSGWMPFRAGGEIRLVGATVRGRCGLSGAELSGGPVGVALYAPGAAFGRVELSPRGGHATTVNGTIELSRCHVASDLVLNGLRLDAGDHDRFVDCEYGRIDGELLLAGAHLTGNDVGVERIALLAEGLTAGGVGAYPDSRQQPFRADGAVIFRRAQVVNAVDLAESRIAVSPAWIAIHASGLQARDLSLSRASVVGTASLLGAKIERFCNLGGTTIEVAPPNAALDGRNGRFGLVDLGSRDGAPFRATGALQLAGAEIADGLNLGGAQVGTEAAPAAVELQRLRSPFVGFSTAGEQTSIHGRIDARAATIDGELDLRGARVRAAGQPAVNLSLATVGTVMANPDAQGRRLDCDGSLYCVGVQIAQTLDLAGARIVVPRGYALNAAEATIGRVRLAVAAGHRFDAVGGVSLRAATVGQAVNMEGAHLVASGGDDGTHGDYAFLGERLRVAELSLVAGKDAEEQPFVARGSVVLVSAEIAGTLRLDGALIEARDGLAAVIADGAAIGRIRASGDGSRVLRTRGQLRMPAIRVERDIELAGAKIRVEREGTSDGTAVREHDDALLLVGATVTGALLIDGATLRSASGAAVRADRASIGSISGGLKANRHRLRAMGAGAGIDLSDVRIHGGVVLDHAKVKASHGPAVVVSNAAVGSVELSGARLRGGGRNVTAILGDRLATARVVATSGLRATGTIDFREAKIEDRLELYGATVDASASERRVSLNLSRAHCPTVTLGSAEPLPDGRPGGRTTLSGELLVTDAAIAGALNLKGVVLHGPSNGDGAVLDRATIGTVRLDTDQQGQPSELRGRTLLRGTRIAGQLDIAGVVLGLTDAKSGDVTFDASAATIGELRFAPRRASGRIVLLGARTLRLVTEGRMDGSAPGLDLAGLHYDRWDAIAYDGLTRDWRLSVVRSLTDPGVLHAGDPPKQLRSLEPFERLAGTARAQGDEQFARRVLRERERFVTQRRVVRDRDEEVFPRRWAYRAWRATYSLMVGYGYREWQAVISLVLLLAVAFVLTTVAVNRGHVELRAAVPDGRAAAVAALPTSRPITTSATTASASTLPTTTAPARPTATTPTPTPAPRAGSTGSSGAAAASTQDPAKFDRFVYALERVLPAVDLGERSRIRVTGAVGWALGLCSLLGWILVIALIAAVTKTLRRD